MKKEPIQNITSQYSALHAWLTADVDKIMKSIPLFCLGLTLFTFAGCVTGIENPNLASPITDTTKAEITGYKIAGEGPIPDRIWVTRIDNKLLRQFAADTTIKIFPVEPGSHEIEANYFGAIGKLLPRSFVVTTKIRADLKAGVRYILKADLRGEMITFWIEEAVTGEKIAGCAPIQREFLKIYVPIPAS